MKVNVVNFIKATLVKGMSIDGNILQLIVPDIEVKYTTFFLHGTVSIDLMYTD